MDRKLLVVMGLIVALVTAFAIWRFAAEEGPSDFDPAANEAMRVTLIPSGCRSLEMYSAVASPSTLGLVATMTSMTSLPRSRRASSSATLSSLGPIPPSGSSTPCRTW